MPVLMADGSVAALDLTTPSVTPEDIARLHMQQRAHLQLTVQIACVLAGSNIAESRSLCVLLDELNRCCCVATNYKRMMAFCRGEPLSSDDSPLTSPFLFSGLEHVPAFINAFGDEGRVPTVAELAAVVEPLRPLFNPDLAIKLNTE
jgi:hypothetical protein